MKKHTSFALRYACAISFLAMLLVLLSSCWSRGPSPSNPNPTVAPPSAAGADDQRGRAPSSPGERAGGILRLFGPEPDTLDPALAQDVSSWSYMLQIFSGLVALDDDLKVVPDLASDWQTDASGTIYTFHLRQDVKFQNGRLLIADDIKFSLERTADPKLRAPMASVYLGDIVGATAKLSGRASEISGIRVLDQKTVQITIDAPKPYFLAKLTYPTAFVVDRNNVSQGNNWWRRPNGSGPFKLKDWQAENRLLLAVNDNYYGNKPRIDEVSYFFGGGSPIAMYERGEVDVITIGSADIDRVTDRTDPLNKDLIVAPQLNLWYLGLNVKATPFDDPKVRQAFQLATDKERIVEVLMRNTKVKAEGILPPDLPGHDKDYRGPQYDPDKARALLAQSTYGSAERLPVITLTVGAGGGSFAQRLAEMYANTLGVQVNVEQAQTSFFDDLNARRYQMFYIGWIADYPDAQDFLDILFHSQSEGNHTGYSSPDVDRLLEQARSELDDGRRMQLYRQAERAIVDDAPIVPLVHDVDYVLVKPTVKGLTWTPVGILSLRDVTVQPQRKPGTL